jgi:hypothetical protein
MSTQRRFELVIVLLDSPMHTAPVAHWLTVNTTDFEIAVIEILGTI